MYSLSHEMYEAGLYASDESGSMIESLEFESSPMSESCATGAMLAKKEREIDVKEILNDPFIKRAQELLSLVKLKFTLKYKCYGKHTYHQYRRNL